ncbi:hypothetical protein SEVIR_2G221200v4 [Setaria viridis]|uniref:Glutamate receptor n=1 Tax=Setaria viridis TaxID=4556 RepID=A0A4U6VTL3_SETVI|nr:glutamate receptor 2.8-like [Setaria viridis]TKW33250.1 hypothetical protein SEVIR_2G221200v2 [Setaria viridis]
MERATQTILFLILFAHHCAAQNATKNGEFPIGVILDLDTLVAKIARTSIQMALEDFYAAHKNYNTKLVLHIRDSYSNNVQAASAALDLLDNHNVQVIIGPQKSSQASFVSDLGNKTQVPVISFTATSPSISSGSLPYFVRATLNDSAQVNTIASLIKVYGWRQVVPIYEDTEYGKGIIPYLIDALQEIDVRIPYRSVIPLSASSEQITLELYKLMTMQTRVFLVHMSSALASKLFTKAKEVGMMNKGFVWIMTDGITNIIDSLNPSVVEAMNGALGIKFYVPKSEELDNFTVKWNRKFQIDNPNDPPLKLSIFGLWGYDTIWAVAQAVEKVWINNRTSFQKPAVPRISTSMDILGASAYGPELLKTILQNKFRGLSGYFDLSDRQLQVSTFQIINVIGKEWREIGFWTTENGIPQQLNHGKTDYRNLSISHPNSVIWPGKSTEIPKGWEIPVSGKKLQVGVHRSMYPEFMTNEKNPITGITKASGFSVDIFEEAVKRLPYALPYEYVAFDDNNDSGRSGYNDFVYQVYLKKYDIAIGDITISSNRTSYVDFTVPYTESGVAMVVPYKNSSNKNTLVLLKPLSSELWIKSSLLVIYTGVVVWLLEFLGNKTKASRTIAGKLGITAFFSLFGDKDRVERVLSRIVLIVWVFCFLFLGTSYTANLTTLLTIQQLSTNVTDFNALQKSGEHVGYRTGSYVGNLLEQLGFDKSKIKPYNSREAIEIALSVGSKNGGIAAYVHEVPYIKVFLAEHSQEYTMVGPHYKTAGFGFALPKGSPLLGDISKAILDIVEGDTIIQIRNKWRVSQDKYSNIVPASDPDPLTTDKFMAPFLLSAVVSTSSLLIAVIIYLHEKKNKRMTSMQGDQNKDGVEVKYKTQDGNKRGIVEENEQLEAGRDQNDQKQEETGSAAIYRSEKILHSRVVPI